MKNNFSYHMPVRVCYDVGLSKNLSPYVKGDNVLLICDPFLFQNGVAEEIGKSLAGKNVQYFSKIEPNPSCESVDEAAAQARAMHADCMPIQLGR